MNTEKELFDRAERLLGTAVMEAIAEKSVMLFGVGGVGSWCAETLIRSGIRHLTLVDSDRVCASNVNRQLMATTRTIGEVKVEALRRRLLDINPAADITALQRAYDTDTAPSFGIEHTDYVVDAIDSLENKAQLILHACSTPAVFFSSMGAALKMDPTRIQVAEFWKVKGCPLGAALRRKFKKSGQFPAKKFKCVFSEELLPNRGLAPAAATPDSGDSWSARKAQINGSLMHITAIFGCMLGGLVLQDIRQKAEADRVPAT